MGQGNASPHLGDMYIQYMNEVVTYYPGNVIQGTLHVHLKEPFICERLVLGVYGNRKHH